MPPKNKLFYSERPAEKHAMSIDRCNECTDRCQPVRTKAIMKVVQQDGARCCVASSMQLYLLSTGIRCIVDWPANSTDCNVIEQIWPHLKREVGNRCPLTLEELVKAS